MTRTPLLTYIKKIGRPIFTTAELVAMSGKSPSTVSRSLRYLDRQGAVYQVYRGIWAETNRPVSAFSVIPFLQPRRRAYLSFISALHLYGIIEQIPQVITLASSGHTGKITTAVGVFSVHQITPRFFKGFDWYKGTGDFLIAEPEKALIDCLYLAGYKKRQFAHFPELAWPETFSFKKARAWIEEIPNPKIVAQAVKKLEAIEKTQNRPG